MSTTSLPSVFDIRIRERLSLRQQVMHDLQQRASCSPSRRTRCRYQCRAPPIPPVSHSTKCSLQLAAILVCRFHFSRLDIGRCRALAASDYQTESGADPATGYHRGPRLREALDSAVFPSVEHISWSECLRLATSSWDLRDSHSPCRSSPYWEVVGCHKRHFALRFDRP